MLGLRTGAALLPRTVQLLSLHTGGVIEAASAAGQWLLRPAGLRHNCLLAGSCTSRRQQDLHGADGKFCRLPAGPKPAAMERAPRSTASVCVTAHPEPRVRELPVHRCGRQLMQQGWSTLLLAGRRCAHLRHRGRLTHGALLVSPPMSRLVKKCLALEAYQLAVLKTRQLGAG